MTDEQFNHLSQKLASIYGRIDKLERRVMVHHKEDAGLHAVIMSLISSVHGYEDEANAFMAESRALIDGAKKT